MTKIKRFFIDFWPSMIVFAFILYATLTSDPAGADEMMLFPGADKLIHAIMMGGFLGAVAFDFQRRDKKRNVLTPRFMIKIFIAIAIFGVMDELLQAAMDNGRGAEVLDYCADIFGELVAFFTAPPAIRAVLGMNRQEP